jgi:serine/threonine protein kinase/Flp pilus assembly protein TadD
MTAGETVSHYEIREKLGEGGMGVVYKALDLSLQRFVALKFLPAAITANPTLNARFEAEARAISALNHPNIATIHAMDEDNGRRFLVLEYLEGGTLRERIRSYRSSDRLFPMREAVSIGIALGTGLGHAHRRGVVHRDIKPENVMFTEDGTLRIADFGLARPSESPHLTRDGATVGTAAYMGPEQALRNEISPRGDLFAVGVILYELIAGRRPFQGLTEFATLQAMLNEQPPPMRLLRPETPPELERILLKLLDKNPNARYQTGDDLASDLRKLEIDDDVTVEMNFDGTTRSLTRVVSLSRPARRYTPALLAAGIAIIALLAAAAWMKFGRHETAAIATQVAVLPFTAPSGNPDDIAFGNGLSTIVAGKLASLGANVVSDNDLRRYRISAPADARRVFGVPAVLAGKFERLPSGNTRVTLQVVDTSSGKVLRSATVASGGSNGPMQDELLRQATTLLGIAPDAGIMAKLRADDPRKATAYDYYVVGNGYLQRYDQAGYPGFAIASFQKAIRIDPSYAIAYAGLSTAYWLQYQQFSRDHQDLERAHEAAMQAISRNESLAAPHITLGAIAVAAGQVQEGIAQLRLALERDPVNAEAYRELATAWVAAGKVSEAEATYKRAIQYRPGFWLGYADLAVFYNDRGRYHEAEETLKKAASLTPDNYIVYRNLGGVQMALGEWPDAERSFRRAVELRPQSTVYSNLGTLYILLGRYADAVPVLEQAVAFAGGDPHSYVIWGNLGDAYRWTPARKTDAPAAYRKAIDFALRQLTERPDDPILESRIAVYEVKAGDSVNAEKDIRGALKLAPRDSAVFFRAAIVHELEKKRRAALADLDNSLKLGYSLSVVEREPELAALRADPAYSAIAAHAKEKKK